ncbi:hypothetical protein VNO78_06895 [Psophocarpus tetragonolobus]|uniref:Uncharacterized protein n=1 Tax=Psophocarpus tetragonolobus TaxID=3891 RepID=A0AAN9XRU1_PSOTE
MAHIWTQITCMDLFPCHQKLRLQFLIMGLGKKLVATKNETNLPRTLKNAVPRDMHKALNSSGSRFMILPQEYADQCDFPLQDQYTSVPKLTAKLHDFAGSQRRTTRTNGPSNSQE